MKSDFVISGGSAKIKRNTFVAIDKRSYGEAAGSVYYGPSEDEIKSGIDFGIDYLMKIAKPAVSDLYDISLLDINPISKSALAAALLHNISYQKNIYPWDILGLDGPTDIRTSVTVCISDPEKMIDEIKDSRYPIIKIKMGFEDDEILVDMLRKYSGKTLRVDANAGWSREKAERMIHNLAKCGVEIIEQPTSVEFIKDWKFLKGRNKISLFVDEGLNSLEDYQDYSEYIDGINVKISKSGGIIGACDICGQARREKIKVMLGCMVESSIGISQAVYLSSLADYFDLDGPILLKDDISSDIIYDMEKLTVGDNFIGGPKIKDKYLEE